MTDEPTVRPDPPELLEELEIRIEKLIDGGDGFARVGRFPIFVGRAAPGDRLRVRVTERKADFGRAEIVEVLEPGPGRREPPCPYFATCGGCDLQHLEDEVQVAAKVAATRETLERIGGLTWPDRVEVVSASAWAYRLRTRLHLEPGEEGARVGYRARRSHDLVPVERCPVLVPELEALLPRIAGLVGDEPPGKVEMTAGDDGAVTVSPPVSGLDRGAVSRQVGDYRYEYDARCFFQTHAELLPRMIELAIGDLRGDTAADLYAGVGFFGLPLAKRYDRVIAVEAERSAVRYLKRNRQRNRVSNLETVDRAVETWIRELPHGLDRVLVDPPRTGLPLAVRAQLVRRPPRRLTYVSCHPGTLARDLRWMRRSYRLESLALLDLFPQTGHMEVVAQMAGVE